MKTILETERLIIRKFNKNDWKDLYEYLSIPEIYTFEQGEPIDKNEAKALAKDRSSGKGFYAVVLKSSDRLIGHIYFNQTEPFDYMTWELGFIFNPLYQNNGYGTESSKAIIDYGFNKLYAHRIIAYCNAENIASRKLLEKIGMRREGHFLKKAYFKKDRNNNPLWFDSYSYAILRDEYFK